MSKINLTKLFELKSMPKLKVLFCPQINSRNMIRSLNVGNLKKHIPNVKISRGNIMMASPSLNPLDEKYHDRAGLIGEKS